MAEEVIKKIHSIHGDGLSDLFKSFNLLIQDEKEGVRQNLDSILATFSPQNYFHKLMRLQLLDLFKQYDKICNIFKSCDVYDISHALKFDWFFKEIYDCNALVNNFMPSVSYSTKMKMVKQYSKNLTSQKMADNLFVSLQQRYDINLAFELLPACSEKFIRIKMPSFRKQVPPDVFNRLYSLYPDLMREYLEFILDGIAQRKRSFRSYCTFRYESIFINLASKDPKLFIQMFEKYNKVMPFLKIGRRTSKRLVRCDLFFDFIKNGAHFSSIAKSSHILKYMNLSDIEALQLSLFPKTLSGFFKAGPNDNFITVTKHLSTTQREEILLKNFNKAFGRELTFEEFSTALSVTTVKMLPEDIRVKWIEWIVSSLESTHDKIERISLLPTSLSIPLLKQMMENEIEMNVRADIITNIMKSIQFNKDVDSISEIIYYFIKRYRNDSTNLRINLMAQLSEAKELLILMKVEDWSSIDELLKLIKLNKEQLEFKHDLNIIFKQKIINFFKRGLSMESYLQNYFETQKTLFDDCDYIVCTTPGYQKTCLSFFLSYFPKIKWPKDDKNYKHARSLFESVCDFNVTNAKYKVDIPDWLLEKMINFLLLPKLSWEKKMLIERLRKVPDLRAKVFPRIFPMYSNSYILSYSLKQNPLKVFENIDGIMTDILKDSFDEEYNSFFKAVRIYSSFGLADKICGLCQKALKAKSDDNVSEWNTKCNAIRILSVLISSNIFVEIASEYYPTSSSIEYSDANHSLYEVQEAIARCLKYLNNSSDALVPLRKFATGDYLKYTVGSINSISLRIPEEKILPLLKEWMDSPVSVRKNFFRSFYGVAPKDAKSQLIMECFPNEKNVSLRYIFYQHAFKFFTNEPSEQSFEVFRFVQSNLTDSDTSAINDMFDLDKIPNEFVSRYVEMLWELVSRKSDMIRTSDKNRVISLIDNEIFQLLNEEFCERLLQQIFSLENIENVHLFSFICYYLLYSSEKDLQLIRLDKTMNHLKTLIGGRWDEHNLHNFIVFPIRKAVYHLIKILCDGSRSRDKLFLDPCGILKEFKSHLKMILREECIFEELLYLDFTIAYHEHFVVVGKSTPELFISFTKSVLVKYNSINSSVLLNIIISVIPFNDLEGDEYLTLCERLISDSLELCNILGIHLISNRINNDASINQYKNILKTILQSPHTSVKICANSLLKSLTSTVTIKV